VASSLAQRIEKADVEIGSMAGAGLSLLEQGKLDAARVAFMGVRDRMKTRTDWFQGRELVEALFIKMAAAEGRLDEAVRHFGRAVAQAESSDVFCAAWLTVHCAQILAEHDPEYMRTSVSRFAEKVKDLGYNEMSKRYSELLART
jgi:hypothetical protein